MQFYIVYCCAIAHSQKSSSPFSTSRRRSYTTLHNLLSRLYNFTQLIASLIQFHRLDVTQYIVALTLICIIHNFRQLPVTTSQNSSSRRHSTSRRANTSSHNSLSCCITQHTVTLLFLCKTFRCAV